MGAKLKWTEEWLWKISLNKDIDKDAEKILKDAGMKQTAGYISAQIQRNYGKYFLVWDQDLPVNTPGPTTLQPH